MQTDLLLVNNPTSHAPLEVEVRFNIVRSTRGNNVQLMFSPGFTAIERFKKYTPRGRLDTGLVLVFDPLARFSLRKNQRKGENEPYLSLAFPQSFIGHVGDAAYPLCTGRSVTARYHVDAEGRGKVCLDPIDVSSLQPRRAVARSGAPEVIVPEPTHVVVTGNEDYHTDALQEMLDEGNPRRDAEDDLARAALDYLNGLRAAGEHQLALDEDGYLVLRCVVEYRTPRGD